MDIGIQICVLVATQCGDMPFCPISFTGEDLVEFCKGIGQKHPEGVLRLSDTNVVLEFKHKSDMMAEMCHLIVVTIWCSEPIILCSLSARGRQVKE